MRRSREFEKPLSCSWSARPRTFRFVRNHVSGSRRAEKRGKFAEEPRTCSNCSHRSREHDECLKRKLPCRVPGVILKASALHGGQLRDPVGGAHSKLFYSIASYQISQTWRFGNMDRALRCDLDLRLDNVLVPIAFTG